MLRSRFLAIVIVAFLPSAGQAESHSATIADGQPWVTTGPNGTTIRLTLNPDGSGRMQIGIMGRAITWAEDGDRICLGGMPQGAGRCFVFQPVDGGFAGEAEDGGAVVLMR
jgi:hypothetical protein